MARALKTMNSSSISIALLVEVQAVFHVVRSFARVATSWSSVRFGGNSIGSTSFRHRVRLCLWLGGFVITHRQLNKYTLISSHLNSDNIYFTETPILIAGTLAANEIG
jgi:hypothetical protein